MADRIATFEAFYPWYLKEHQRAESRWLHFAGTSAFLGVTVACLVERPLYVAPAIVVALGAGWAFFGMEGKRSAAPVLLGMIAILAAANPGILVGVFTAYFCAWVGHFVIEKNRPATFTYPLWSLAGDFRMWSEMARGRRWSVAAS